MIQLDSMREQKLVLLCISVRLYRDHEIFSPIFQEYYVYRIIFHTEQSTKNHHQKLCIFNCSTLVVLREDSLIGVKVNI